MRHVVRLGWILATLGCLWGTEALAFKLNINRSSWSYMPNPIGEELVVCPTGMPALAVQRTRDAAVPWNYERLQFTFGAEACLSNGDFPALNSVNQIDFGPLASAMLANTVTFFTVDAAGEAAIIECDTRFNSTLDWYDGFGLPPVDQYDWQSVATHELGHCLGLAHEDTVTPAPVMRSRLLIGTIARQLTADDLAGRNAIYDQPRVTPAPGPPPALPPPPATPPAAAPLAMTNAGSGGGGCSLLPGRPAQQPTFAAVLGNIALPVIALWLLRVCRRCRALPPPGRP